MSWYWWVLLWAFVLILAFGVLARLGLSLFRKARDLARELSTATDRLAAVSEGLQELGERQRELAVFRSASELRQEQFLSGRAAAAGRPLVRPVKSPDPGRVQRAHSSSAYDDTDR